MPVPLPSVYVTTDDCHDNESYPIDWCCSTYHSCDRMYLSWLMGGRSRTMHITLTVCLV